MLIECVPNVSEGRRLDVVQRIAGAVAATAGVRLLDVSSDHAHNRSVFTLVGEPDALRRAVPVLFKHALAAIDLRQHQGGHPRIGAVDVVPFVPLGDAKMEDCVTLAREVGADIAGRFDVPVYLYEEAARNPARARLEDIRRGGFEGLAEKMSRRDWAPDFGPVVPHPTGGATAVGARRLLIAYNINLATDRIDIAQAIARAVRSSGGGLSCVKAIGVALPDRGIVQVSMNLTDYARTSITSAFDRVTEEAGRHGIGIVESEIIGLAPAGALSDAVAAHIRLRDPAAEHVLERRLGAR
jgi:glutamate formiminotransferase